MIKTCIVEKRNCYGNTRYFPKCRNARLVLDLMRKNSFAPWELKKVRELGYVLLHHENLLED